MRHVRIAMGLLLVVVTAATADTVKVDFSAWDHELWRPAREPRFPQLVPFIQRAGFIENLIPAGPSEKDIVAAKDGIGVAMMLLRDRRAGEVAARASLAFERKGAPSIIFRVQREGEVTGEMYSLVLYAEGVNLWKFAGGKWAKVGASKFEVAPTVFHDMRLYARGGDFTVFVDGTKKLLCTDPQPLGEGEVGLWSGEGPCFFQKFSLRPLALRK